jgi:hypothetical protein
MTDPPASVFSATSIADDASAAAYYIEMSNTASDDTIQLQLTMQEVAMIRQLLAGQLLTNTTNLDGDFDRRDVMREIRSVPTADSSVNSNYPEFRKSTHAWAVFADDPHKRATSMDRFIGVLIIFFQLFTYWIFAQEAIKDYSQGQVYVKTSHSNCLNSNQQPGQDGDTSSFTCEANFTNGFDAFIAYFMLGVFLTGDFLKAARVMCAAPTLGITTLLFASLTAIEIVAAYTAACISVSYNLYIGELTDAVAVGVGVLFIRELSQRAYTGIRYGKVKQYTTFFGVLAVLIGIGMLMDPFCEYLFVDHQQYR